MKSLRDLRGCSICVICGKLTAPKTYKHQKETEDYGVYQLDAKARGREGTREQQD